MEAVIIVALATIAGGLLILLTERNIHDMTRKSNNDWRNAQNQQQYYLPPKHPLADQEWPSYHMNANNYPMIKSPNYGYNPQAYRDYYRVRLSIAVLILAAAAVLAVVLALKYLTIV